jgi:hypothetical protein
MALTKTNLANIVEGILPVANGGTGTSTGVSPGGSTTQVQYNNAGAFGGSANLTFDGSTLTTLNSAYTGTLTGGTGAITIGTNQIYKDTGGNVGIGTTSPGAKLNVFSSGTVYAQVSGNGRNLYLGQDATGGVIYSDGAVPMVFYTNGTEKMRITSAGGISFGATGTAYGTSGQVLTSAGNASPTWGAVTLPAGTIRQVVNGTISTTQSTSSASAQNSGLTASITPASTSNKVFITISSVCGQNYSGRSEFLYVYKNGAQVFKYELFLNTVSTIPLTITYLDSPATTSSTSYALWYSADGLGPAFVSGGNTVSSITLMEVVG